MSASIKVLAGQSAPLTGKAGAICNEIEKRLSDGHYKFGDEISSSALVEEFQASRAPVATALNHLRAAGYLIVTPQVGCKVISPALSDIEDFFFVFGRAAGAMAYLAAERHERREVEALWEVNAEIKKATPKKGEKLTRVFLDLVSEFHATINSMAHSEFEARHVGSYWRLSEFYLFNLTPMNLHSGLATANKQREEIVAAIELRESEKVELLMADHIRGKPKRVGTLGAD